MLRLVWTAGTAGAAGSRRRSLGLAAMAGTVRLRTLARAAQAGVTECVSVGGAGARANGVRYVGSAISADGRYVSFGSAASKGVAGEPNGAHDVFVRDRRSGETRRVSVSSAGARANGESYETAVGADGRGSR
jgi:hypothetical protein